MLALIQKLRQILVHWWSEFALQTKLMAVATLVVSLIMSGLTFWAVNTIQEEARLKDTRFGNDLGLLLAANAAPMVAEQDLDSLARFSSRFFQSTSSVRYLLYADPDGNILFGIPYSTAEVQNSLTIKRRIELPDNFAKNSDIPLVRQHITPVGEVTDVFVPLNQNSEYLGVLAIGINPDPTGVSYSNLTRDVTIAVFISIWAMVILGAVFNALIITRPIKELLVGVKNIAAKNFQQRIDLPARGELGELIVGFNYMAERLEKYEKQNIEELRAEKAKLESLVSTIADGAILIDSDLNIILANATAKNLLNWQEKFVSGQKVLELLPFELTEPLHERLHQIAFGQGQELDQGEHIVNNAEAQPQDHNASRDEFTVTITNPTKRTLRVVLTQVLGYDRDHIKGVAMTIQDITREAELNEAKGQFISNVSHELRTPLFNIKSFIETLFEYGDDLTESQRREFLETANNETDRLTRLVNDVLSLSRLESSRVYHLKPLDVTPLIEQTIRTYQLNAKDKKIELTQEVEPNLPEIVGHYDLLLQVITNLVGNSLKFTPAGGRVVVRAYSVHPCDKPCSYVRVEVSDTGIGIAPEDQQSIFDRFYRVENRVHTLEGTGLGLSIVKHIIEKHHSKINLISEVGVGTTFWFDLVVYEEGSKSIVAADKVEVMPEHLISTEIASPYQLLPQNQTDSIL